MYELIEVSHQQMPQASYLEGEAQLSLPLHTLAERAPSFPTDFELDDVRYSISNDESAPYFDQTRARVETAEYQGASNRVALLVGESSLSSALPMIPEETIVILDKSPILCAFMQRYVDSLRAASDKNEWAKLMGILTESGSIPEQLGAMNVNYRLLGQVVEWESTGYRHAFTSSDVFDRASRLAKEKAIIIWNGDLTSTKDMEILASALRDHEANITMINLTNAVVSDKKFKSSKAAARRIGQLPVAPNAPILTTGFERKPSSHPAIGSFIVKATGPFFGLENFRNFGGNIKKRDRGPIYERHYHPVESTAENPMMEEFVIKLLELNLPAALISELVAAQTGRPSKIVLGIARTQRG